MSLIMITVPSAGETITSSRLGGVLSGSRKKLRVNRKNPTPKMMSGYLIQPLLTYKPTRTRIAAKAEQTRNVFKPYFVTLY